jgi:hypothetical protein
VQPCWLWLVKRRSALGNTWKNKRFFFEKKKQKTFVHWIVETIPTLVATQSQSFLVLFFKKERFSCPRYA